MISEYVVLYTTAAIEDLDNIYIYIAYELAVPNIAKKQILKIEEAIKSLAVMPMRNRIYRWEPYKRDGSDISIHIKSEGKYSIIYRVEQEARVVRILRILYGGRELTSALGRSSIE